MQTEKEIEQRNGTQYMVLKHTRIGLERSQDDGFHLRDTFLRIDRRVDLYIREKWLPDQTSKLPVVLLHGAAMDGAGFDVPVGGVSLVDALARNGSRTFTFDFRGHGRSSRVENGLSVTVETSVADTLFSREDYTMFTPSAPASQTTARSGTARLLEAPLPSEDYVRRALPSTLGQVDMTLNYIVILFNITIPTALIAGGAAGLTYLVIGSLTFFVPCALVTAQLATLFPHEGALYNWTHKALGGFWSFFSGFCAWLSGVLVIVVGPNLLIAYLQALHPGWLPDPWQQGLVTIVLVLLGGFVATRRLRTVQYIINVMTVIAFMVVPLTVIAALVWFMKGHPSATSFSHLSDWSLKPETLVLFGTVAFAYLGTEVPLNMGGEMVGGRKTISRHLLWGTCIVFIGYVLSFAATLIVEGQNASFNLFAPVLTVDAALGKFWGNLTAVCIMCYFLMIPVVFSSTSSRLLLVGAIDAHLPRRVGLLNQYRVPANAIWFQTFIVVVFAAIVFVLVPSLARLDHPADFVVEVYNVVIAAATLVWATSVLFLFLDVLACYIRDRQWFVQRLVLPLWLLLTCAVIGPITCVFAIIETLLNSFVPQISNSQWWYLVGGLTLVCFVIAGVGGMFATSEAAWQVDRALVEQDNGPASSRKS